MESVDRDRRTALHWASEKSAEKSLRLLLEDGGAEVRLRVRYGFALALGLGLVTPLLLEDGGAEVRLVAGRHRP